MFTFTCLYTVITSATSSFIYDGIEKLCRILISTENSSYIELIAPDNTGTIDLLWSEVRLVQRGEWQPRQLWENSLESFAERLRSGQQRLSSQDRNNDDIAAEERR